MMDINKFSTNLTDEVVFHDGISNKDQRLLNEIFPARFIEYDFPINDTSIFNQGTLNYFSKMVYSKFECFKLLNDYEKVLFLDYNQVIKSDISELLTDCCSGFKISAFIKQSQRQFAKSSKVIRYGKKYDLRECYCISG